jgi:hypothetical protein
MCDRNSDTQAALPPTPVYNTSDMAPPTDAVTKKRTLVIVKKKPKILPRKIGGIPNFGAVVSSKKDNKRRDQERSLDVLPNQDQTSKSKHHLDEFFDDNDDNDDSFPSEAQIAIDSLTTTRRELALEIPLQQGTCIYGVLECQIQEFYRSSKTNGSSRPLCRELELLVESGKLMVLSSPDDVQSATSLVVYVKTLDYLAGVHDALSSSSSPSIKTDIQDAVVDWFGGEIVSANRGRSKFTYPELLASWNEYARKKRQVGLPSAEFTIRTLQDRQLLLSVNAQILFQLSLPSWGSLVLPAFRKATKDSLTFIKQSRYNERSIVSLEKRLVRSPIPVARLLIPWLISQGLIRRYEKPSGMFVSLIAS